MTLVRHKQLGPWVMWLAVYTKCVENRGDRLRESVLKQCKHCIKFTFVPIVQSFMKPYFRYACNISAHRKDKSFIWRLMQLYNTFGCASTQRWLGVTPVMYSVQSDQLGERDFPLVFASCDQNKNTAMRRGTCGGQSLTSDEPRTFPLK